MRGIYPVFTLCFGLGQVFCLLSMIGDYVASADPGVHEGYISWERWEAVRKVCGHMPTRRHHGAPKDGDALLAALVLSRRCGRKPV